MITGNHCRQYSDYFYISSHSHFCLWHNHHDARGSSEEDERNGLVEPWEDHPCSLQLLTLRSSEKCSLYNKPLGVLSSLVMLEERRAPELAGGPRAPTSPALFGKALQFPAPERTICAYLFQRSLEESDRLICFETAGKWALKSMRFLSVVSSPTPGSLHWCAVFSHCFTYSHQHLIVFPACTELKCFSLSLFCVCFVSYRYCYLQGGCCIGRNFFCTSKHWLCFLHLLALLSFCILR